jgi:23S rRNA (adenine2503-C2)-methyltransferase
MTTSPRFKTGSLLDVPFGDWAQILELAEGEAYRVKQLQEGIFVRRATSYDQLTTLPQTLRAKLAASYPLRVLKLVRQETSERDGTARLFFETGDHRSFSTVFLPGRPKPPQYKTEALAAAAAAEAAVSGNETKSPAVSGKGAKPPVSGEQAMPPVPEAEGEGDEPDRFSLCVSSQVGCAWGCVFCASGRVLFRRNLEPSEILEQVFQAEAVTGKKVDSVLFMGMGEPLANYQNLLWALRLLRSPLGFNLGARHVTVSTSGLVPQIDKLAQEGPKVNLAISLHAPDDETRRKILPKSSSWPIKALLGAAWNYQRVTGNTRVTFEYILLKGINDSLRASQRLANLLRAKKAWVNLIAYNPVKGLPYERPSEESVRRFARVLIERGVFVRVRKPQGVDISAGCGQLGEAKRL